MNDDDLIPQPDESLETEPVETPVEPPLARLVLKRSGAETDVVFELRPPSVVGRFDPEVGPIDVDLGPLPEGVYVSRKHARIECQEGVWKVVDLGSSNGTFLLSQEVGDFERVQEADLVDGAEIAFGNVRFVFRSG